MKIPFSPPYIDSDVEREVLEVVRSGWITTGPKVKALESLLKKEMSADEVICVNSWTSGAQLIMKWFGVGPGDEVIIPAYTYAATATAVLYCGAKPVMVDSGDDFNITVENIAKAINDRTKVIMPVDIGGWPFEYDELMPIIESHRQKFHPNNEIQAQLGRILVLADAAHSIGAERNGIRVGALADVTVTSFHAVKNITTAEGGAISLKLPDHIDIGHESKRLRMMTLNGQSRGSFDRKTRLEEGSWMYDIVCEGLKINMPDICAAIGLVQMRKYHSELLPRRKKIFDLYTEGLQQFDWVKLPPIDCSTSKGSAHLYNLRLQEVPKATRNLVIKHMAHEGIAANVHFIPLPLMTYFKSLGYSIESVPNAYAHFQMEISLPIYPQLKDEEIDRILQSLIDGVKTHVGQKTI